MHLREDPIGHVTEDAQNGTATMARVLATWAAGNAPLHLKVIGVAQVKWYDFHFRFGLGQKKTGLANSASTRCATTSPA